MIPVDGILGAAPVEYAVSTAGGAFGAVSAVFQKNQPVPGTLRAEVLSAGEVVAEDEWRLVGEEQLELSVADLGVKHVHPGRVDVDQHVVVADGRLRDLADLHRTLVLAD
jgi:hypothetical protein